ncbi:MAG: efflux RND transporter periplasmic adaptor subunit [Patescibacteria group bacterium]
MNLTKTKALIASHKIISSIIFAVLIFGGYGIYRSFAAKSAGTLYLTEQAAKGTIISTVTGSGQVSASNQVEIKSKVSGTIVAITAKSGQDLPAGALIAQIDSRDASIALQSAELSYAKLTAAAKPEDVQADSDAINKAYADGWNTIASVFTGYPAILLDIKNMYELPTGYLNNGNSVMNSGQSIDRAYQSSVLFAKASSEYEKVLVEYNSLDRTSDQSEIEKLISDTSSMVLHMSDAIKSAQATIVYMGGFSSNSKEAAANVTASDDINAQLNSINSYISNITSAKNSITSSKNGLATLQRGADKNDIQIQALSLSQKQNDLSNYYIRAPFGGVITKFALQKGNTLNTGDVVATILSKNQVANVSLNEVDAAKVKVGQKATLTFDAIDNLTISGTVADVDLVGTVSQGVVTYNVKINFDTTDPRVLSGMTANASIITEVKQDVITVPIAAVKSSGSDHYVEMFDAPLGSNNTGAVSASLPTRVPVEIGLSSDTSTEILSGINEGDNVVIKSTNGKAVTATAKTSAPSLFGAVGGRAAGR